MNALGIKQVAEKVNLGKSTIYRMIERGEFPKPFVLTGHRTAWVDTEIDAWLAARVAAARGEQPQTEAMQQTEPSLP
ncbi:MULTISPECIES: AlpA family phage regulatory protein [unclassified Caballeronia]|uniref:AlpA family phage regulatory protein n=1 Tax=unclassified Caballeronia TaxID=2646786 RepID=UPI00285F287A|nr:MULTISPECIES: AlpA family phage regulatory protein [unclassified Caballeronia]MDR5771224.1 AlpA family phage regulatory protein [Caballeronia sp. LZ002]MDR5801612.1 AlpA family phage regulatory protein [Caballeronia sp. LZ001]MDR5846661.1 AlpA family phage regulatory protein [Caballeronia sp. LZ003]